MEFYVDGSCSNNGNFPNEGGFAVIKINQETNTMEDYYYKRCKNTTNNREELKAILYTFLNYGLQTPAPIVFSDSAYSINTLTNWMFKWANNGWVKSDNKPPENLDLIKAYYEYYNKGYRIDLRKVKGHSGNQYNEFADRLAKGEIYIAG